MILCSPFVLQRLLPRPEPTYDAVKVPRSTVAGARCASGDLTVVLTQPLCRIHSRSYVSAWPGLNPVHEVWHAPSSSSLPLCFGSEEKGFNLTFRRARRGVEATKGNAGWEQGPPVLLLFPPPLVPPPPPPCPPLPARISLRSCVVCRSRRTRPRRERPDAGECGQRMGRGVVRHADKTRRWRQKKTSLS